MMKATVLILASALTAAVVADQPHNHHARHHHKRAEEVVWVTDWETVFDTVDITTTIWVSSGYTPSTTSSDVPAQFHQDVQPPSVSSTSSVSSTTLTTSVTSSTSSTTSSTSSSTSSSSSSSSIYVAPSPSSTYVPPPPPPPPPVVVDTPSSSPSPVVVPPPSPPAVVNTPAASPPSAPAPASSAPASSGSPNGGCTAADKCSGDITWYDTGMGACGWTNDGTVENVVALPHGLMGTQSNGNPYCGTTITVEYGGSSVIAKVVDKCMGCVGNAIDLSKHAFSSLLDEGAGRAEATWYFN